MYMIKRWIVKTTISFNVIIITRKSHLKKQKCNLIFKRFYHLQNVNYLELYNRVILGFDKKKKITGWNSETNKKIIHCEI